MIRGCVLVVAVLWKLSLIYFYIVVVLGQFGTLFIGGLVFRRFSLFVQRIILTSSAMSVVALIRCDNHFCI